MKVLVTGATGFIGRHLVEALCNADYDVRCLVRKSSRIEELGKLNVEISYGDLFDLSSLEEAVMGVSVIFHTAGELYSSNLADYDEVNVRGTKNLFDAAINKQIDKIVYFSSIAATGPMLDKNILLNENALYNPINFYGVSKHKTEVMALQAYQDHKIPVTILRLPIVYGPGISEFSRVFLFLHMIRKRVYRVIGNGENILSLCYIDNLIRGALLVAQREHSNGKIYLIADKYPYTINEIVQSIAREEKIPVSDMHIPTIVASGMAIIMMMLSKVFAFKPVLTRNLVKEATSDWGCDISRAQKELNYEPPVEFEEGLRATVRWYMENY